MFSATASASTPSSQVNTLSVEELEKAIANNTIAIFSKSWCPYCTRVKELFKKEYPKEKTVIYELNEKTNGSDIQDFLYKKTGQRTVPNIFIGQKHIGGCDDTFALHKKGGITPLLKSEISSNPEENYAS